MDTLSAYARSQAARGQPFMVFDWDRAATLIRERQPTEASAGLAGDWAYTGGTIYSEGAPVPRGDTYTFLSSNWATPELDLGGDVIECWRWNNDSPGWGSDTYWPESALAILNGHG